MWRRRKSQTTSGVCRDCSQLKNVMGGCSCDGTCQGCGVKRNERGSCGCTSAAPEPETQYVHPNSRTSGPYMPYGMHIIDGLDNYLSYDDAEDGGYK